MTVASTVSTLPLSVILLTTPASVMMTVTVIQKTSVMEVAYVRLQFAWQTQNVMGLTKFAMLSMTTASIVERMIVLPMQMAAVQVITPFLQPIPIHKYKLF